MAQNTSTVANWFEMCEDIFRNDLTDMPEDVQSRLRLWRLDTAKNEKLNGFIHPGIISSFTLDQTVLVLSVIFGERNFEVPNCFTCLCQTKEHDDKVHELCDISAISKDDF
ncbi:unnamed protein product [Hymenolepis diminuta]|uniref:Uncharacterized protein n=1 Tax=Hymenolepis diminuta TaxID=6216 RepID=A0A564YQB2_HYMDI|nr:unnamed protein product [Hymenolepis diminuta]VUZ49482.1 unnamed protein product [Hymenolepis diminuta]